MRDAERQLKEAETFSTERENAAKELQNLRTKLERTQASIDALQEEHGSNLQSEAELRRLRQLKKNYQTDFEKAKKKMRIFRNK